MSDAAAQRRATLVGLVAILLWASLALLTTATGNLPPFQVLAIGFGIAAFLGLVRATLRGAAGWRELRQPLPAFALSTLALFGYHALYFIALKRAPAVEANLLNYMWPLLIVVFAGLFGGVAVRPGQWLGTTLGLVAAVLLVTRGRGLEVDPAHVPGYLAALGAALIWSLYSVLNRRYVDVPTAAITVACAGVALSGAIVHLLSEQTVVPTRGQWLVLILMGVGPVGAAFWLWDHGTKRGDIALLGSLSYLAPLLSTLLLVASGRAQAHWIQAVAIVLLLSGAWLSVRASRAP
ncbi:drug/metabolite transporter (DMT)-like permease [Pseudoxanthomonas japonensis]|uniref:aromatic amino acid exporter YddG n=1 Tax=Pseudoxanthomonas TaxID=83618 RepID=UPI000A492F51|nr:MULTISPECIES: EamA family transporter [Pseudoxanthomonas]MDR7068859.1 drug/metabolite transporter (DMT)-like permease [Pseudoxanthomonas japonensis]